MKAIIGMFDHMNDNANPNQSGFQSKIPTMHLKVFLLPNYVQCVFYQA